MRQNWKKSLQEHQEFTKCLKTKCSKQGFWYFARSRTHEIQVFLQNPVKYREIHQKYFQIHVRKTYFILILAITPVLFTPNIQIYLETSSLQRANNVPKLPGVLDERCDKLGTNHHLNSFNIRSFFEPTVDAKTESILAKFAKNNPAKLAVF